MFWSHTIMVIHYSGRIGDKHMKRLLIKAGSALLVLSMVLPAASCGKAKSNGKGSSGKKISEDTPWFNTRFYEVDKGIDKDREVEFTYSDFVGADDKNIVLLTNGNYKMPDNIDWETYDYTDYSISTLTVLDRASGKTVKTINMNDVLGNGEYAESARYVNGKVTVIYSTFDSQSMGMSVMEKDIDIETGTCTDTRDAGDTGVFQNSYNVGEYIVETSANWNSANSYFYLTIFAPDGSKQVVELKDERKSVYEVSAVIPSTDTTALVIAFVETGYGYYELDLKTGKLTETENKDYEWLDLSSLYSTFNGSDGNVYYTTPAGISKIDIKAKTDEEMFNYSWCGINRNILTNLQIAEISEDAFLLCGSQYKMNGFTQMPDFMVSDSYVIEFTKADKNPHAGKTILEMYASSGFTEDTVADAILKFNETNNNYFIEVKDRYKNIGNYDFNELTSDDEMDAQMLNYGAELSNKLSMDIMNGEGPDMLLNVSSFGQLNNPEFLTDLTPYVGKLDPEKYFTNIADAAKVDGKLYNLPVCFSVEGIQTDAKYAGASGIGFTTDEYVKFLNETLNGTDVIVSGQAMYFAKLFNSMSYKFIKNGKADFSDPDLAALAEYVKDNVQEQSVTWNEDSVGEEGYSTYALYGYNTSENGLAMFNDCYSYYSFFRGLEQLNGASAILGIPSTDGHGPMAGQYTSIAVSAQASNVDACGEFVKMLLSDSVQEELAMAGNLVLNREAFRKAGNEAVAFYNKQGGVDVNQYDNYGNLVPPKNKLKFNEGQVDDLEKIILACTGMETEDAAINLIIVEEMQPYFAGQKDLNSVLNVAQDRVQKVLDERG